MMPRYLICLSLVLFLGVALSYKLVYSLVANRAVVYGFVILLFLMSIPFVMIYYSNYTKEDWRGVSSQLGQMTKDGDYVVVVPGYVLQPLNYYYSNTTDGTIEYGFSSAEQLDTLYRQNPHNTTVYYLVTGDIMSADPSGGAFAWLKEHTTALVQTNNMIIFTSG
jgi:mannosyltransferase